MSICYRFRTFERSDLPMISRWLRTPEVRRWWGEPETEYKLLLEDLDEPAMRQWIVEYDGHAFAYIQAYRSDHWPQSNLSRLPAGSIVVDTFIGEPDMLGAGHGRAFLRAFARMLIDEGAPALAIDPAADNYRARKSYAKAGFVGNEVVESDAGPAVVMVFRPPV